VVPASPGTFTIPAAALSYLPAVPAGASGALASLILTTAPALSGTVSPFLNTERILIPPLVGGGQGDFGLFTAGLAIEKIVAIP
jgi:hypothetical protein